MTPDLTPDARAAYEAAGFSRRDFLKRSGALVVAFSAVDRLGLPGSAGTPSRSAAIRTSASRAVAPARARFAWLKLAGCACAPDVVP